MKRTRRKTNSQISGLFCRLEMPLFLRKFGNLQINSCVNSSFATQTVPLKNEWSFKAFEDRAETRPTITLFTSPI